MRLTDKMMLEEELKYDNSNTTYNEGFADGHRAGAKFAREFYENQKCGTCRKNDKCSIRIFIAQAGFSDIETFGCNRWEEAKHEIN